MNLNDYEFIVIKATDTAAGIGAEFEYINQIYGTFGVDWKLLRQKVMTHILGDDIDPIEVDILTIKLANGEVKDIIFDISEFYAK